MDRPDHIRRIARGFENHPVVGILGPRQSGKTTLAQMFCAQSPVEVTFLDLENPRHLTRLENPMLALEDLSGLIIIDEIQRQPGLFEILRIMVDRQSCQQQFLILGSASRDFIRQSSESLAGRITYLELSPFALSEVGPIHRNKLWLRDGFQKSPFICTMPWLTFC